MHFDKAFWLILGGVAAAFVITRVLRYFFSTEAKMDRRRRRSNARINNRAKRPTVKFSVHTKDDRSK